MTFPNLISKLGLCCKLGSKIITIGKCCSLCYSLSAEWFLPEIDGVYEVSLLFRL